MYRSLIIAAVFFLAIGVCEQQLTEESLRFPHDFQFGASTAAYQIEGAWNLDGKGENIWDRLLHTRANFTKDSRNGDVACDSYHFHRDDVRILKEIGVNFYRFSISWSRILPTGRINRLNRAGIAYYDRLIDDLLANGIEPMVTLYHGDLPQALQDLGGWTNALTIKHYERYANLTFAIYGDRVKKWLTFNEPIQICAYGYGYGAEAPAINQSGYADYICGRNVLISHARVYRLYRALYAKRQKGQVGITINTIWAQPKTMAAEDALAAERSLQMDFGWWMNPIFSKAGDYPKLMRDRIAAMSALEHYPQSRLPAFSPDEIALIRGTADFLGLNHYSTWLASDRAYANDSQTSRDKDVGVRLEQDPNWPSSSLNWLKVVPWGFRKILNWIRATYDNPLVYVTENGFADDTGSINDSDRINYHQGYLKALLRAIHFDGCNVKAYSAWSVMDNFEWGEGYTAKFGLYYVNFTDPKRRRVAKASSHYYKHVIKTRKADGWIAN